MKKSIFFTTFFLLFNISVFSADFQIRLMPAYSYFSGISNVSAGGILSFDISPLTFRTNDSLRVSAQASFFNLFENGISSEQYIDYNAAVGYNSRSAIRQTFGTGGPP